MPDTRLKFVYDAVAKMSPEDHLYIMQGVPVSPRLNGLTKEHILGAVLLAGLTKQQILGSPPILRILNYLYERDANEAASPPKPKRKKRQTCTRRL